MLKTLLLTLLLFVFPLKGLAMTTAEAQQCADQILEAYNQKKYPKHLLSVPEIIQRAYGPPYRTMHPSDKELADAVATELLRTSFTEPSGKYRYKDLEVSFVKPTKSGFSANGSVHVSTPDRAGTFSFTALLKGDGCAVYQVRIADFKALDISLREMLESDARTKHFFE